LLSAKYKDVVEVEMDCDNLEKSVKIIISSGL